MDLKKIFTTIYSLIIILLITLSVVTFLMYRNNQNLVQSNISRFNSFIIADQLKQSSDDLTKYCRIYVETGDTIWEKKYWEVLDIRNGKKPRSNGRTISLIDSMKELEFTEVEFAKLNEAEANSNHLVWTEKVAFHAIKGLFSDSTGQFSIKKKPDTALARTILFDKKYHYDKSIITKPIDDFIIIVKKRKKSEVEKYTALSNQYFNIVIGLILMISIISIISFFLIKNKIIKQLDALKKSENIQRELNATKDKLFSIIAHDLRTPFNNILGFSELLIENTKYSEVPDSKIYSEIINSSAKNTLVLLDNLLNWANSQTGKIKFNPEKINLSAIIQETLDTFITTAKIKNISLNYISSENIEVYLDPNMLKIILRNIISNSIKFTNLNGKITIYAVKNQDDIEIIVSDNGIGMNEETKNKLFKIDTNITTPGTAAETGSGLGLILCKEFIEKQGGEIGVESELGKGSDFKFTFPLNSL